MKAYANVCIIRMHDNTNDMVNIRDEVANNALEAFLITAKWIAAKYGPAVRLAKISVYTHVTDKMPLYENVVVWQDGSLVEIDGKSDDVEAKA